MFLKKNKGTNGMTRGRFLSFLGKIGLLSLITGTSVFGADRASQDKAKFEKIDESATGIEATAKLKGRCMIAKLMQSPLINGKMLTRDILEADLATRNLENVRDLLTGRFFGKAAEAAFKDGYTPLINWDLGSQSAYSGCFMVANMNPGEAVGVDAYTGLLTIDKDSGNVKILLKMDDSALNGAPRVKKIELDFNDFAMHPTDGFVSQVTGILKTTDIDTIEQELKAIIFSDEVLNMGIEHIIFSTNEAMIDDIDRRAVQIDGIDKTFQQP